MKKFLFFFSLFISQSCTHEVVVIKSAPPIVAPTTKPTQEIEAPKTEVVEEIKNIDLDFQKNLKKVWPTYFKENYNDSRSIDIYMATNRQEKNGKFGCTDQYFSTLPDGKNSYRLGICRINVPKNHSTGEIPYNQDPRSNSHQFYKIVQAKNIPEEKFYDFLQSTKRLPLIFVHGFNVRYQEALLRASQLAYDIKYQGPIILFSWPSGAGDGFLDDKLLNKTYESNQKSAKGSIDIFKDFLRRFKEHEIPVNLVVHSMGHQVVLPALNALSLEINSKNKNETVEDKLINELILNAPDFDVSEFQNMADNLKLISRRITLYCSYNDKAMMASSTFNKSAQRLGACANVDGIDIINVGLIDNPTFGLGHSYYSSRAIITDVFQVLLGIDAEKRLFMKKSEPNSTEKFFLRN